MTATEILKLFLSTFAGLSFFLFGMNVMSSSLEQMAGGKLERVLKKVTSNPILGILAGAAITIAVQSSSAITVMLVGLVNSGIMLFSQTIFVIFGANIGTTLTAWILSLSGIESDNIFLMMLKPENFAPILALIGIILLMFTKSGKKKSIGTILVGFAVLMYGMELMSDVGKSLGDLPGFSDVLIKFSNPFLLLLISTLFTGIIQSSAASVGIVQALSLTGVITNAMCVPIVMGQNIGTCATALISCIGTDKKAKRVAVVHLLINLLGTILFLTPFLIVTSFVDISFFSASAEPWTIAMFHTIFNILATLVLMPFSKLLISLVEKLVPDKEESSKEKLVFLDERLLASPSVAINELSTLASRMCTLSRDVVFEAIDLFDNYTDEEAARINNREDEIDIYEDRLGSYLVKLSSRPLSVEDSHRVSKMLHTIGDFERLGDHAANLVKTAKEINSKGLKFSEQAKAEIAVLVSAIREIFSMTAKAYTENDLELASRVEPLEQVIDGLTVGIKNHHIERLQQGGCTIELGFVLSDLLTNYERISDHCSNIAVAIIEARGDSFDAHEYLKGVKYGNEEFAESYKEYSEKYAI